MSLAGPFYKKYAVTPPCGLGLRLLVGVRFQVLFHSPPGVLFTFPSRYSALSVASGYLALEGGPPSFPRDSTCPVVLRESAPPVSPFRLRGCHALWRAFPDLFD